jgi:hypothetical protein
MLVWYECWNVCDLCMPIYLFVHYFFSVIESNEECTEEGEVYEHQDEEDQGQANQGKPSKIVAYLIPILLIAWFITVFENALFSAAIAPK